MTPSERSLLIKMIENFALTEDATTDNEIPIYEKDKLGYLKLLKSRNLDFDVKNNFKNGDIIIWKDGMKNKRLPEYKQPAIIIKLISPPKIEREDSNDEELDIYVGFITEDDEFLSFAYDSRRFKLLDK